MFNMLEPLPLIINITAFKQRNLLRCNGIRNSNISSALHIKRGFMILFPYMARVKGFCICNEWPRSSGLKLMRREIILDGSELISLKPFNRVLRLSLRSDPLLGLRKRASTLWEVCGKFTSKGTGYLLGPESDPWLQAAKQKETLVLQVLRTDFCPKSCALEQGPQALERNTPCLTPWL